MNGADLHAATGPYALNALSDKERRAFEKHLAGCEECRREVAELQGAAARLGQTVVVTPPPGLKDRVLHRVANTRQERRPLARGRTPPSGRWNPRLVLAASVAAVAALGAVAAWQSEEADTAWSDARQVEAHQADVADVLAAPDAELRTQPLVGGGAATVAVSHSQDAAVFIASGLPPLPSGQVYELWFGKDGDLRPAGLLTGDDAQQIRLLDGPVAGATAVGVTVEPAGGSPAPTSPPLGMIRLPV
ncbi:anti-sigma factor [Streptomyces sp. NPDC051907]|uniref:anti-sigma factor n=1 Tax=Streptomyces sp. NPDC051907 TaxID=3155284 RepID=UPI003415AE6B